MAERPVFIPATEGNQLVLEVPVDFKWHPGMAFVQKRKNVVALHEAARAKGLGYILEISTKSDREIGRRLSAFNQQITLADGTRFPLECVYQGSKVFENGGPYEDLFHLAPKDAKRDRRLKESGNLVHFELEDREFPLVPKSAFYDWLYATAIFGIYPLWTCSSRGGIGARCAESLTQPSPVCLPRSARQVLALAEWWHQSGLPKYAAWWGSA